MQLETQNTVFAARVRAAAAQLSPTIKRSNGRLVPLSVLKASAFPHSDWDVFECMIKSAVRAGTLRTMTMNRIVWVVL